MPSSVYKRPRLAHSEPPPTLPDHEISFTPQKFTLAPRSMVLSLNEVMSEVFSYLSVKDVYSCIFVNKSFHRVAFPHMYRHVDLSPSKTRRIHRRQKDEPVKHVPAKYSSLYTKSVEFHPHRHDNCKTIPHLGDLHVSTIFANTCRTSNPFEDWSGHNRSSSMYRCYSCPEGKITSDRLVVRPYDVEGRTYAFFVPKTESVETIVFLRHLVPSVQYVNGHSRGPGYHGGSRSPSSDPQPVANPARTATFVILPQYWDHGVVYAGIDQPKFVEPLKMPVNLANLISHIGCWVAKHSNHAVTIVGLENRNPFARPEYWKVNTEREDKWVIEGRDKILDWLKSWTKDQQTVRMSSVHFIPFEQYLVSNAWSSEYLSPVLVHRWLNLLRLRPMIDDARGKKKLKYAQQTGFWYTLKKNEIRAEARALKEEELEKQGIKKEKVKKEKKVKKEEVTTAETETAEKELVEISDGEYM